MLAVLRQSEPLIRWPLVLQDPWTPDETMVQKKFDHYDKNKSGNLNLDENEVLALAQVPRPSK